jgi:hypothetical protein
MRADGERSGAIEAEGSISSEEVNAFRDDVENELRTEEENLSLIGRHDERARKLVPLLLGLLVVNVILAFTLPHYAIYWILASFFVYMYYFIVLIFPTTRRVRTPAEKKEGVKAKRKPNWGQGAKGAITRGKKVVTIAFWNSFFIGTQTLARGITLTLAISISFALLALVAGTLDLFSTSIIVIQAIAIIGYYYVIIYFRPYSKDFLRTVTRVRRDKRAIARWRAYLKGLFIVFLLLTVFAIFIISAIFFPKRSLDAVLGHIDAGSGLAILELLVILVSQFVLIRYVQGFDSARITTAFIKSKLVFLGHDVLTGLEEIEKEGAGAERSARFRSVRTRFRVSRIYKVVYKDLFGILPTYPIIVDFRSILEKDVADALGTEIPIDIPSGEGTQPS